MMNENKDSNKNHLKFDKERQKSTSGQVDPKQRKQNDQIRKRYENDEQPVFNDTPSPMKADEDYRANSIYQTTSKKADIKRHYAEKVRKQYEENALPVESDGVISSKPFEDITQTDKNQTSGQVGPKSDFVTELPPQQVTGINPKDFHGSESSDTTKHETQKEESRLKFDDGPVVLPDKESLLQFDNKPIIPASPEQNKFKKKRAEQVRKQLKNKESLQSGNTTDKENNIVGDDGEYPPSSTFSLSDLEHKNTKQKTSRLKFDDTPAKATSSDRTSGQVGSMYSIKKYRQISETPHPSERLKQEDKQPPVKDKTETPPVNEIQPKEKKLNKLKFKSEDMSDKLNKARNKQDKLANKKPKKIIGFVKNINRFARFQTWSYFHKKLYEAEHENVGIEAAHRTELTGEAISKGGAHFVKRRIRTHPARRVRKLEKAQIKSNADYAYKKLVDDKPELKSNIISRFWQKKKLKQQYAKKAKEAAKHGAKAAEKTAVTTEKIARAVVVVVKRHPIISLIVIIALLIIMLFTSVMSSMSLIGNSITGSIGATSYLAADIDIDKAELAYTEWETDLQLQIKNIEHDHPGYNEYKYQISDISHNPFELMAFLTAAYYNFTFADVESLLKAIFNEQYTLSLIEETETRINPETGETYEWRILNVSLIARSFTGVIFPRMDSDQRERYNLYMILKGNRQYLQNPFNKNWLPFVTSRYGYRVHPTSGKKDYHKGVDIGLPAGTDIMAGQDGTVTFAGNNGAYGLVVVIDDGAGLSSKYAHCSTLYVAVGQIVQAGDKIALVGNTGNSTGAHLHLEIIKDGNYLNPLYFAVTGDYEAGPEYGNPGAPMGDGSYAALLAEAEKYIGMPYVWGGSSPSTSFDCSGYICWILNQAGVANVGRTTAQGLYNMCTPVAPQDAKPGDLIFYTGTYSTTDAVTHIGLYTGNGMMLHCGNPIGYASVNSSYWSNHFYAYGRIN